VGQFNINDMGLTIGGTVGCNWQFAPAWLVGLEGDFGTLGLDHTVKEYNDVVIMGAKADWYGIRGRFGCDGSVAALRHRRRRLRQHHGHVRRRTRSASRRAR
jgi:hypothetical protein